MGQVQAPEEKLAEPVRVLNVFLVATPFGLGSKAYHSSVMLGRLEFAFSSAGIERNHGPRSHLALKNGPKKEMFVGEVAKSPEEMCAVLRPHFREGTYDLLRKNCNNFSDCALFWLLGLRLDSKYRFLETLAKRMGSSGTKSVSHLTGGSYKPNPKAAGFSSDSVTAQLSCSRKPS